MDKKVILVGSIGSLKAASIMVGTFYAAKDLGYEVVGMAGASGSTVVLPLLAQDLTMDQVIDAISSIDEDKLGETVFLQAAVDRMRKVLKLPKRKGARPFKGAITGNGIRTELTKLYDKHRASFFEQAKIPFIVVAAKIAEDNVKGEVVEVDIDPNDPREVEEIFNRGEVVQPIRASTAIPIVFEPEFIEGRGTLVDGGLVDAIPIFPAVSEFGNHNVIIADATNDIFEKRTFSSDLNNIIDILVANIYATVSDSTLTRIDRAANMLSHSGHEIIRVKPERIKIKMFEVDKFRNATLSAYYQAKTILQAHESRIR